VKSNVRTLLSAGAGSQEQCEKHELGWLQESHQNLYAAANP